MKILTWFLCIILAFSFFVIGEYNISATWAAAAMIIATLYRE
jgi:hypothetical protein